MTYQPDENQQPSYGPSPAGQPAYPPPGYPPLIAPPARFDPADPLVSEDYAGWWRRSMGILRRGWRSLTLVQLIVAVPVAAISMPAQLDFTRRQQEFVQAATTRTDAVPDFMLLLGGIGILVAAGAIAGLIFTLGLLANVRIAATVAGGGRLGIGAAFAGAARRLPAMTGWYLLASLITMVGALACLLPAFYLGAVFAILPVVVYFERGAAITRCFRLFHSDIGAAAGRVVTVFALGMICGVVNSLVTGIIVASTSGASAITTGVPTTLGSVLSSLATVAYYIALGTLSTPLLVTTYADLRARHEPFTSADLITAG